MKEYADKDVRDDFRLFVSEGFIFNTKIGSEREPVKVFIDTGFSQSLIEKEVLPRVAYSATGRFITVRSVSDIHADFPLHIGFTSDLGSGNIVEGVILNIPIKGISMILGNNVAGDRVFADHKIYIENVTSVKKDSLKEEN